MLVWKQYMEITLLSLHHSLNPSIAPIKEMHELDFLLHLSKFYVDFHEWLNMQKASGCSHFSFPL